MKFNIETAFRPGDQIYYFSLDRREIRTGEIDSVNISIECQDADLAHSDPHWNWTEFYTLKYNSTRFRESDLFRTLEDCQEGIIKMFRVIQ